MKRNCLQAEAFVKHRGQQVLPCVLLHMVETSWPSEGSLGFAAFHFPVNDVRDILTVVPHIQNLRFAYAAKVARLRARPTWDRRQIDQE